MNINDWTLKETYVQYDGPLTFSMESPNGIYLLHWCDIEHEKWNKYICLKVSEQRLADFVENKIDYRTLFSEPEEDVYIMTLYGLHEPDEKMKHDFQFLTEEDAEKYFPNAGVYITP